MCAPPSIGQNHIYSSVCHKACTGNGCSPLAQAIVSQALEQEDQSSSPTVMLRKRSWNKKEVLTGHRTVTSMEKKKEINPGRSGTCSSRASISNSWLIALSGLLWLRR